MDLISLQHCEVARRLVGLISWPSIFSFPAWPSPSPLHFPILFVSAPSRLGCFSLFPRIANTTIPPSEVVHTGLPQGQTSEDEKAIVHTSYGGLQTTHSVIERRLSVKPFEDVVQMKQEVELGMEGVDMFLALHRWRTQIIRKDM